MSIRERIRGYSQISNQIMFAIIVIVIIFVAITSSISYTDTKNNIEKTWQYNILSSEQWMSDSLILMGDGLRLFELTYDDDLKEAFTPFFDAYNKSDGDPLSINLAGIRSSLYPAVRDKIDFYIIDPEGIVINSTYQKDIGMNFQSYNDKDPELFSKLTAIRLGDSFESDRAVLGFNHNKTIRKFLYAPSPDHQYLLELSYSIDKYVKERADFSYLNIVESVDKTNPEIKRVTLYDRGLRPIHKNTTFLPEYSIQNYEDLQKVVKTKKPFERVDSPNNTLIRYFYVDIGGNKTVSGNLVDMVTRIEYDTTILNDRIKSALLYHCIVIFLAALLGLIIAFIIS
ncbi:MAG TPA: hypothetical protein VN372_13815, partial [Methanospirillum sp.]|nr:hypothetical protein [Methanospirillum sp.]